MMIFRKAMMEKQQAFLENHLESDDRRTLPAKILCNKLDEAKIENSKRLVRKYEQVIELIFLL